MEQKKIKIKKGDEVIMLNGKDKGKKGKVLKIIKKSNRVIVEGLNLVKKNLKPKKQGEKGEIISMPRSVNISNVAIFCSRCNKGVRVGFRLSGDQKMRICRKCQETI
jgi:large subunit ribosomal protein L24